MAALPSTLSRPISLRRRRDLETVPQMLGGERVWAIKDPLGLQYFHLRETEYWILQQLNGTATLEGLVDAFAEEFAPQRLRLGDLQQFLGTLHQSGLVLANSPKQADELLRRKNANQRRRFWQTLANPLALRFRGLDPDRALTWIEARMSWLIHPWVGALGTGLVIAALLLVASRFDVLLARLPARDTFFSPANLLWIAVALGVVKVLHELGHALACKHFGGECHEMGLMLLCFTPCLYCNVSDAWMLPGKWQRAAVGLAGMGVELVVASVATFLWWYSVPGAFNSLCLNVMFVCSVGTLLINGNPLLRYDGYYVLSDLTETPNLSSQAASSLKSVSARWILGVDLPSDEEVAGGRPAVLVVYAVLAAMYRAVVLFGILWISHRALQPYRLQVIVEALALVVAIGMIAVPAWKLGQLVTHPWWGRKFQTPRAAIGVIVLIAVVTLALMVPLPSHITAAAVVQPVDARRIFAVVPGRLIESRLEGETIASGEPVAKLVNTELEREIARLRGERDQQKLRVENLKSRQVRDETAAAQLPPAVELLADFEQRLQQKLNDDRRLTITAPVAGTIIPPRPTQPTKFEGTLPFWTGTPLDQRNLGCQIETGTLLCQIGDPAQLEALLIVDQEDVEFVAPGQTVEVRLDQNPGTGLPGTIAEIAEIDLAATPPELVAHAMLATRTDDSGLSRPVSTSYQARVTLRPTGQTVLPGETGRARIDVRRRSLGSRLVRLLRSTFDFHLVGR